MTNRRLQQVASGLWAADSASDLPLGVQFPLRMTVLRLGQGELLLHSPIPIDDALASELGELGSIAYLVAPNRFHHLHLAAAARRYPEARVFGAAGLAQKRPDVPMEELHPDALLPWGEELEPVPLEGAPKLSETVFLHRASRSLIVTDLVFNMRAPVGFPTRCLLTMVGAYDALAASRSFFFLTADREALSASVRQILSLEFDKIIPAHGAIVFDDARNALFNAVSRLLKPARAEVAEARIR